MRCGWAKGAFSQVDHATVHDKIMEAAKVCQRGNATQKGYLQLDREERDRVKSILQQSGHDMGTFDTINRFGFDAVGSAAPALPDGLSGTPRIPANVSRGGRLKAFRGVANGRSADERAYRFGQFCLARIALSMPGSYQFDDAVRFSTDNFNVQNAAATSTGTDGNHYLIPSEFRADLIDLREKYGVARRLFKIRKMSSDTRTDPRVRATSSEPTAVLSVFSVTTGELIGTLSGDGFGGFRGRLSSSVNPEEIIIQSSFGGSATASVSA